MNSFSLFSGTADPVVRQFSILGPAVLVKAVTTLAKLGLSLKILMFENRILCLSKSLAACSFLLIACFSFVSPAVANEELTLELAKLKFDPLLQFYPPPANSRDKTVWWCDSMLTPKAKYLGQLDLSRNC
jgi:hypothetical protein